MQWWKHTLELLSVVLKFPTLRYQSNQQVIVSHRDSLAGELNRFAYMERFAVRYLQCN